MYENFNDVDPRFSQKVGLREVRSLASDPTFWLDDDRQTGLFHENGSTVGLKGQGTTLQPGTYEGQDSHARFVLRVEEDVLSGDIFRLSPQGGHGEWAASFRSEPSAELKSFVPLVVEDKHGAASRGALALRSYDSSVKMSLTLESHLTGLPVNTPMRADLFWEGPHLRKLVVQEIREIDTARLSPVKHRGRTKTLESCLEAAGIAVRVKPLAPELPTPAEGVWSEKALIELMMSGAHLEATGSEFATRLCMLSRSNRSGLAGIMFDALDAQQRQWLAVFTETVAQFSEPGTVARNLLHTTLHELGHALNLVHRFERSVGRMDSTSIMNYPQTYRGGGRSDAYWNKYDFSFDPDELSFLKHGPHNAVRPGGRHFHAVRYWETGKGGYSPYLPEALDPSVELEILAPRGGPVLLFAQPVILGLRLKNNSTGPLDLPQGALDQKAGRLEFLIEREATARHDHMEDNLFAPIVHRFQAMSEAATQKLAPNEVLEDNANLTFGTSGFPFAEPGNYRVTAYLSLSQPGQPFDRIVKSRPLRLRISMPQTRAEEAVALEMLSDEAGLFFALGGLPALGKTQDVLMALTKDALKNRHNPLAANIRRAAAFGAGREYVRIEGGSVALSAPDAAQKRRLLESVVADGLSAFDPVTAARTAAHYEAMSQKGDTG